jgi:hypothetical protein
MSQHSRETSSERHDLPSEIPQSPDAHSADRAVAKNEVQAAFREYTAEEWNRMSDQQQIDAWAQMSREQQADNLFQRKFLMEALYAYQEAGTLEDHRYQLTEAAWTEFKMSHPSDKGYVGRVAQLLRVLDVTGQSSSRDYRKAATYLLSDVEQGHLKGGDRDHAIRWLDEAMQKIGDAQLSARLQALSAQ